jgi:hypothetical protein
MKVYNRLNKGYIKAKKDGHRKVDISTLRTKNTTHFLDGTLGRAHTEHLVKWFPLIRHRKALLIS